MAEQQNAEATIPNGEEIVERFGGIRPMAAKLEVPVTTVQGWKKRDAIPLSRRDEIISAASQYNINLKGLLSTDSIANQNARSSIGIAEDPALHAAPAQTHRPAQAQAREFAGIDLKQVRRAARTTSFLTSVSLVVVLGLAGFALFGGHERQQSIQLSSLQNRVSTIESQGPVTAGGSSGLNATISDLQGQVRSLTNAIGANGQDLLAGGATLLQRLAALEQQLGTSPGTQDLQGVVQRMENMIGSPEGVATWQTAVDELRTVVAGLQGRVDGLDVALADVKTQNSALATTLSDVTGRDLSAAAMLLALTQVRQAVDRQAPFTQDMALLRQIAANTDPELAASIDRLAPYAETGVLSPEGLKTELQSLSNEIITAKLKGEDVAFKDRIIARLQGLFSIKKDGLPVNGGAERDLIARASEQLDAGDVRGAMATLQQLEGPAAQAAAPWQQQAAATVAVETIDRQLVDSLLAKVKGVAAAATGGSRVIDMSPAVPVAPEAAPTLQAPSQPQLQLQATPEQQPTQTAPQSPVIIQQ